MESLIEEVRANLRRFASERLSLPLEGRRHAAVALALIPGDSGTPSFVLTRRAAKLRNHAGQWALPGGRLDAGESPERGALREMHEEVGLALDERAVLGRLDDYGTRSGFVITPVVVWSGVHAELRPDPKEVTAVYRVPIAELSRPGIPHLRRIPESERPVISLPLLDTHIHAPTAAILYQLREVALFGRATRVAHFEQPLFAWK
jgi:8-oxo-dGTP pyrophosphatase MutT (NUDIX family)